VQVLMVASENDALPGAKVGGIADVLRDLPPALATRCIGIDAQTFNDPVSSTGLRRSRRPG